MYDRDFGDENNYDYGDYEYEEFDESDDFYLDPEYPVWDDPEDDDDDDDLLDDDYGSFVPNRPTGGPVNTAEAELIYS